MRGARPLSAGARLVEASLLLAGGRMDGRLLGKNINGKACLLPRSYMVELERSKTRG